MTRVWWDTTVEVQHEAWVRPYRVWVGGSPTRQARLADLPCWTWRVWDGRLLAGQGMATSEREAKRAALRLARATVKGAGG